MTDNRPLSPHLGIYRHQLTSVLSILHRITGIALSLSAMVMIYWLAALATGMEPFARFQHVLGSLPGQFFLLGAMFSFFFHLCNGVRHLFWDMGKGLEIERTYLTGWIAVFVSLLITAAFFLYALSGGDAIEQTSLHLLQEVSCHA